MSLTVKRGRSDLFSLISTKKLPAVKVPEELFNLGVVTMLKVWRWSAWLIIIALGGGCQLSTDWLMSIGHLNEFVRADQRILRTGNQRYRFLGVNIYSLLSRPKRDGFRCGPGLTDNRVRQLFVEMADMGLNAVRFGAYQSYLTGRDGRPDYTRFDLLVRLARRYRIRLIPILENQWRNCTQGGYKITVWYQNGYQKPYGTYRQSYMEHVTRIVRRYRNEPAIMMWQLINEPEVISQTGTGSLPLKVFAKTMRQHIRQLDPNHLVCLGSSGLMRRNGGRLWYSILLQDEVTDIAESHDYGQPHATWPAPRVATAFRESLAANKPFIIGEVGIPAPPFSREERARLTIAKLDAAWQKGVDGILIWAYRSGDGTNRDFDRQDPLYQAVKQFTRGRTRPSR